MDPKERYALRVKMFEDLSREDQVLKEVAMVMEEPGPSMEEYAAKAFSLKLVPARAVVEVSLDDLTDESSTVNDPDLWDVSNIDPDW